MKGKAIIKDVLLDRDLTADEFFGRSAVREIVRARVEAIQRMNAAGMTNAAIARLMRRDHTTISYWLRADRRAFRKAYHAQRWIERRPPPSLVPPGQKVTPEQRVVLRGLYLAGKIDDVLKMQAELGVSKHYARKLGSRPHKAKSGIDTDGLPLAAPVRETILLRCPPRISEARP